MLISSPTTTKLVESASFPLVWEHGVLPFLIEFMPKWSSGPGGGHVISVMRGKKPQTRRICIMTETAISRARRIVIAGHVRDLLPTPYRKTTTFAFSTGEVERLRVWARGLGKAMPDEVCEPRNPFCYVSPCMGDSIGVTLAGSGDEITATLGPCLTIADGSSYWLANFHPFVEAAQAAAVTDATTMVTVSHPSPEDRARCVDGRHDVLSADPRDFGLGTLAATSGYALKTTRVSYDPYWEDCDRDPPLVVTDWCLISARTRQQQANLLRKFPPSMNTMNTMTATTSNQQQQQQQQQQQRRENETPIITTASAISPGAIVCSTGRTSGYQRGMVCEVPAYVHGAKNGTGKATREWFIEEEPRHSSDASSYNDNDEDDNEEDDAWIRGGIGVLGDSGAGVVDAETHALVGQVWGRNRYYGPGPRHTFFTPMLDVIDDVQEKCGEPARPQLPQYRDEADRWPVYPVCRRCFDMREYLGAGTGSRRSSRESLLSMVGCGSLVGGRGGGGGGGGDHDPTSSISELATPKEQNVRTPRDTSYLVRHVGPDEGAAPLSSSFGCSAFSPASLNSVVSPAPVHAFYGAFSVKSPGAAAAAVAGGGEVQMVRSPYAQTLDEGDLFDPRPLDGHAGSPLGKRPRMAGLACSGGGNQQVDKRRRT